MPVKVEQKAAKTTKKTATKKTDSSYTVNCVIKITTEGAKFSSVEEANTYVTHKVQFLDVLGNVFKECIVEDGGHVIYPAPPVVEGYAFVGWDKDCYNIKEDVTITALYKEGGENNYAGKKFAIIGDSISTFREVIPSGYSCFYPYPTGDTNDYNQTWWMQAISTVGMNYCANASYSGGYVYGTDVTSGTNAERIKALASKTLGNPDVVIIHMGVNDATNKQEKAESFKASYLQMINEIKSQYPGVKIFVCTMIAFDSGSPTATSLYNDYVQSIIDIASETDCELIELHKVINFTNLSTYMMDAKHPNAAGMKAMADEVVEVISKYYKLK